MKGDGMTDQNLYAWALSDGMRYTLFKIDSLLSGQADKATFRLIPERYEEAQAAIATLYRIVKHPELEPTPQTIAAQRAQCDVGFQTFMHEALSKRKRRS